MKKEMRRGQVTIFIIIAIVIVAVLLILLYPRLKVYVSPVTPGSFIEDCMKKELVIVDSLAEQGGTLNPVNYLLWQDKKIEYLCYTNEYYKTCVMQQPLLKQSFENELSDYLKDKADRCIQNLAVNYEGKGYRVSVKSSSVSVEIIPRNIKVTINAPITITKETSQTFDNFVVSKPSGIYDLLSIAGSILNWEARYGDSDPESFMLYYPNLKVEKYKQEDGSKVYVLTDRESGDKFYFASRSLSWPAGYNAAGERVKDE